MVWEIREYGAVDDGRTVNTAVIQNTIDRCHQAGGGTVLIEGGVYLCGTIFLRSNVTLEIAQGTVLKANPDISDYAENTHHNRYRNEEALDRCFLYGEDLENIGICGKGRIECSSEAFPNKGNIYRPMLIRFLRCRQIHIADIRLCDAAAWTTAFLDSEYIWISKVYIHNEKRYNGDGLDFDGCAHVFIDNCSITGTDSSGDFLLPIFSGILLTSTGLASSVISPGKCRIIHRCEIREIRSGRPAVSVSTASFVFQTTCAAGIRAATGTTASAGVIGIPTGIVVSAGTAIAVSYTATAVATRISTTK